MTVEEIRKAIEESDYEIFGIRADNYDYEIGDITFPSHQLYQDPIEDWEGNLLYPLIEEGPYEGFYDAGELDGTCAVEVTIDNIEDALKIVRQYLGSHIYLIAGNAGEGGNDIGEVIIRNAEVLAKYDK